MDDVFRIICSLYVNIPSVLWQIVFDYAKPIMPKTIITQFIFPILNDMLVVPTVCTKIIAEYSEYDYVYWHGYKTKTNKIIIHENSIYFTKSIYNGYQYIDTYIQKLNLQTKKCKRILKCNSYENDSFYGTNNMFMISHNNSPTCVVEKCKINLLTGNKLESKFQPYIIHDEYSKLYDKYFCSNTHFYVQDGLEMMKYTHSGELDYKIELSSTMIDWFVDMSTDELYFIETNSLHIFKNRHGHAFFSKMTYTIQKKSNNTIINCSEKVLDIYLYDDDLYILYDKVLDIHDKHTFEKTYSIQLTEPCTKIVANDVAIVVGSSHHLESYRKKSQKNKLY